MALVVTRTRFFLLEINFARGPLSSGYGAGFWRMAVRGKRINAMTDISRAQDKVSAGDPIPPKCAVIEVHIGELKQLFDAIDPSPFRDRDLDPKAEEFIVGWAKDLPRDASLALVVDLDREAGLSDEAAVCGTRFTSFSSIALKHIANGSENCSVWVAPAW